MDDSRPNAPCAGPFFARADFKWAHEDPRALLPKLQSSAI